MEVENNLNPCALA